MKPPFQNLCIILLKFYFSSFNKKKFEFLKFVFGLATIRTSTTKTKEMANLIFMFLGSCRISPVQQIFEPEVVRHLSSTI